MSDSLQPHGLQHARLPCPSPTPRACSNSCPSSQWCHPTISSSVVPFSCPQSFPASESFPLSQLFTSGGQRIGVSASASVLLMNICFQSLVITYVHACSVTLVMSNSLRPCRLKPAGLLCPWDSPGKNIEWVFSPPPRDHPHPGI